MPMPATQLAIRGGQFLINGVPTHAGRRFRGRLVEGMLFISRMANAIVDDRNPATIGAWSYADGPWTAERNTREFIAALPQYRDRGLDAVAINFQGGSPQGYSWHQPWRLSCFAPDGAPYPGAFDRAAQVIGAADALGMAVNLGLFYGWATQAMDGEAAVLRAAAAACDWLAGLEVGNVLLEIGNEIDNRSFVHPVLQPGRCAEMFALARARCPGVAVSTSFNGGVVPPDHLIAVSDYVLLHGNNVESPAGIRAQVAATRARPAYRGQPILYNEDDHDDFEAADNNFAAAVESGAGWGFFDYRRIRERFEDGYQSLPVDWGIGSVRKRGFFALLADITGAGTPS
jgi:hypothetical protein